MEDCCSSVVIDKNYKPSCCAFVATRKLIYHPSNTKKGFPIKGTNLRVEWIYTYE